MSQRANKNFKAGQQRRNRRRGVSMVLVALSLTMIFGFAALSVDYGIQVATKNHLQRACDAAALAGASQLKVTGDVEWDHYRARYAAYTTAAQNGVDVNWNSISFHNNDTQIKVPAEETRKFFFGWAIGVPSGRVQANATAETAIGDTLQTPYVAPIGITWETYNAYHDDTALHDITLVRQNKDTFGLDDFVAFDLRETSSKAVAQFQSQLSGYSTETAKIGDVETTLNASEVAQEKAVERGSTTVFAESALAPWFDSGTTGSRYNDILNGLSSRDNPRVMHFIVTPSTTRSTVGTFNTRIEGFVPVYIEAVSDSSEGIQMRIRFLPPTTSSDGKASVAPQYIPGTQTPVTYTGVRVIRLTS